MKLDEYQRKVVRAKLHEGMALRVVANAGAGKSTTVLYKVERLIKQGANPSSIVVISFSRKSRQDLVNKWKRSHSRYEQPFISTIHSLGLFILRRYLKKKDFKLMKPHEQMRVLKGLIESCGGNYKDIKSELFGVMNEISYYKAENLSCEEVSSAKFKKAKEKDKGKGKGTKTKEQGDEVEREAEIEFGGQVREYKMTLGHQYFARVYTQYEQFKKDNGYFDFDDLVTRTHELLLADSAVLSRVRKKFNTYFVDESQDLNKANWDLVTLLSAGKRLVTVGDPCQNIYRFRHARPEFFSEDYLKLHFGRVRSLHLPYNYRSTKEIVELGNIIRSQADDELEAIPVGKSNKHSVKVYDVRLTAGEGALVYRLVTALLEAGYKRSDITVISRSTNFLNTVVEKTLIENNVPYQILAGNNTNFHDSNSINLMFGMIGVLANPNNLVAYTSIIPFLNGMGEFKRLRGGFERMGKTAEKYINLILKLKRVNVKVGRLDSVVLGMYEEITALRIQVKQGEPFEAILDALYAIHFKYVKEANKITRSQYGRIRGTAMNFINDFLEANKTKSLRHALDDMLINVSDYDPEETDRLILSTIHAQKGLESKVTIACGFRSYNQLEDLGDDINALYVQMSRAIEKLIVVRSSAVRIANRSVIEGVENPKLTSLLDEMGIFSKFNKDEEKESPPW